MPIICFCLAARPPFSYRLICLRAPTVEIVQNVYDFFAIYRRFEFFIHNAITAYEKFMAFGKKTDRRIFDMYFVMLLLVCSAYFVRFVDIEP